MIYGIGTHIGSGAGYCSFLLIHESRLVRAVQPRSELACFRQGTGGKEIDLRPSDPISFQFIVGPMTSSAGLFSIKPA